MKEDASDLEAGGARHLDVANEPVAGEIHVIGELDRDAQVRVLQRHVGDERIGDVAELSLPAVVVEPGELPVDEKAGPAEVAHGLIGIADARKIDVANRVVRVEADAYVAVSDDKASGHGLVAMLVLRTGKRS